MNISYQILGFFIFYFSISAMAQIPEGYKLCDNRIENGDFESIKENFITTYKFTNQRSYLYGPMVDEGEYGISNNPKVIHHMFAPCRDHTDGNGNMMVINGSPAKVQVVWGKRLNVKPNQKYLLSFWLASAHNDSPAELEVLLFFDRINKVPIRASSYSCKWTQHFVVIETGSKKEVVVSIANKNTINMGNDFLLDDIMLQQLAPLDQECENCCGKKENTPIQAAKTDTVMIEEVKPNESTAVAVTEESVPISDENILECGRLLRLDNIQFHDNSTRFKGMIKAKQTLFFIFEHLKRNPNINITLYGHSDIFGDANRNLELTKERVIKIQRWLTMQGIQKDRINYKAFGGTQPLVPEGGAENRRVEAQFECND